MKKILLAKRIMTMNPERDIIEDGYIIVENGRIQKVGKLDTITLRLIHRDWHEKDILDLGECTLTPGFIDTHCFFAGYALLHFGADLSAVDSKEALVKALIEDSNDLVGAYVGRNLPDKLREVSILEAVSESLLDLPIVLFSEDRDQCWLNHAAKQRFGFDEKACYPEAMWRFIKEMLNAQSFIEKMCIQYMELLNSRGVTSVKDMAFDDYYGFDKLLAKLETEGKLSVRFDFMSQPVGEQMNLEAALGFRSVYKSEWLKFSGFNQMTDGSISQHCGDLKEPYEDLPTCLCNQEIPYEDLEKAVLLADQNNIRFSLHAQGDAAVKKCLDIFDKCQKDASGKLVLRHCLTDLEFTDPEDLEKMGRLGVVAEIYPQIQSLSSRADKVKMIRKRIGTTREKYYWNRRKMIDSGVVVSCATDLPLLIDDIPESIFHACGGWFPEGGEPFNVENTLTMLELIEAWTLGGAYNLGVETTRGSLEVGKFADIACFDQDILTISLDAFKQLKAYKVL